MHRRALAALVLVAPVFTACETKIPEPKPDVHPLDPTSVTTTAPPVRPAAPRRCVRERPLVARPETPKSPDPRCPADPEKPPVLRTAKLTFPEAKGEVVTVEIAENDPDRQRGLMYRKSMPQDRGMLFRFDVKDDHAFWMHNTCIPLDMLYLDDDGLIVGIEENTPTMSDDTFAVGCTSRYVLELNAGWTRAHGVKPGQKIQLDGL
jgi:hypothetical protein